jgi:hypothetical protein
MIHFVDIIFSTIDNMILYVIFESEFSNNNYSKNFIQENFEIH